MSEMTSIEDKESIGGPGITGDGSGASAFDFPGMGGNTGNTPSDPTLDLLGTSGSNSGLPPNTTPNTRPSHVSPNSHQPQMPVQQNPPQNPPTTKSHLAEILGSHEMLQLQTMSRTLDTCPSNSMPPTQQNRPNNSGMMAMRPDMVNPMGNFNPQMPGYNHMPFMQGNIPPFRYPRNPGDFRQSPNFDPGRPVTTTPPGLPSKDEIENKKAPPRKRRPSSRKNSRDGDDTSSENQRKRKRNPKDEAAGAGKSTRKRKTKGATSTIPEGSLLMFSTQMLNEASQEVLKKKKNSAMADFHQNTYGMVSHQLRPKMAPTSTTPPIPSGMPGQSLPGARPSLSGNSNGAHRQSPGNDNAMSPGHIQNVMSPLNGQRNMASSGRVSTQHDGQRNVMVPGRVTTPHDGRMTPGSIHSGVGGNCAGRTQGGGRAPTPGGINETSPVTQSQDSRNPTPNTLSPAANIAPCLSPGGNSQLSQEQEEKLKNIKDISKIGLTKNPRSAPSPSGAHLAETYRQFPPGRSPNPIGTSSPGPTQHVPGQMPGQMHGQTEKMIHRFMQSQREAAQHPLIPHYGFRPSHHPRYPIMRNPVIPGSYGGPLRPQHRYQLDHSGRYPGMHHGIPPTMQHFPHMMTPQMISQMRQRFPDNSMPNMGHSNFYSNQLRQKAMGLSSMSPNGMNGPNMGHGGMPHSVPMHNGPGNDFGQGFVNQSLMCQNGPQPNFNNQNSNGPPPQVGVPSGKQVQQNDPFAQQPHTPNSVNSQVPANVAVNQSYPPSNSPGVNQYNQNGPGLMSPMGSQQPPPGQGQNSSLVNLLHSNSTEQSPYQNQAKSPASQLNGNIMSPTPSQPQGGPPSIAPSIPEFAPTTPSGPPPLSPAHTNPMTPVSHVGPNTPGPCSQNDSYGPMTPSGVPSNQAPMTPLTNPMTPGQPVTPGQPGTPGQQGVGRDQLSEMDQSMAAGGGNMGLNPCSPHTPQFQQRPDAPLTPSTPTGLNPTLQAKMNGIEHCTLPPDNMDMAFLRNHDHQPMNMHPMNMNTYNPRMSHPGLHHGHISMNQSSNHRMMMHQNMIPGMGSNPNMNPYHPQQWAAYGQGGGPRY